MLGHYLKLKCLALASSYSPAFSSQALMRHLPNCVEGINIHPITQTSEPESVTSASPSLAGSAEDLHPLILLHTVPHHVTVCFFQSRPSEALVVAPSEVKTIRMKIGIKIEQKSWCILKLSSHKLRTMCLKMGQVASKQWPSLMTMVCINFIL